ncbi:MAG TPA: hypothetical protein VJR95_01025 [Rhodanobacter sp.]|nr:hypothetical protein [Rhodanobacter sp.]
MSKPKRPYKFPKSSERSPAKPVVLCPADRVINLYNQDSGDTAQRISKKVRKWVTETAIKEGWDGVVFLPEVQSQHGAGCILGKNFEGKKSASVIKKLTSDEE